MWDSGTRFVLIAATACLAAYVYVYTSGRADTPVRSDAFSYYVYLPSWLLFHDATLQGVADECCGGTFPFWTAIYRAPRHRWWIDSHPIGEAILTAPSFIVAHGLTRWSNLSPNGFSLYYVHAAGIAGSKLRSARQGIAGKVGDRSRHCEPAGNHAADTGQCAL